MTCIICGEELFECNKNICPDCCQELVKDVIGYEGIIRMDNKVYEVIFKKDIMYNK